MMQQNLPLSPSDTPDVSHKILQPRVTLSIARSQVQRHFGIHLNHQLSNTQVPRVLQEYKDSHSSTMSDEAQPTLWTNPEIHLPRSSRSIPPKPALPRLPRDAPSVLSLIHPGSGGHHLIHLQIFSGPATFGMRTAAC
ncbi:hypothetical protein CRG98_042201 [Punica granatum]|uniref:Uncharacterized protein n=1 Tax=Punica granatum TaxID=22663 RepID=A0A2I0I0D1_PUNGR|nr:hypothetical protein CRG98_042201 [Punica granatum]